MKPKEKLDLSKIKIRKTWKRSPAEQIEDPAKGGDYNRAKAKREWKEALDADEDFYSDEEI